jgi:XTP/dITP diphosphohydrolase
MIATRNAGKLTEFQRLLGDAYDLVSLDGLDLMLPDEGVESYRANAETKARVVAMATGLPTLGDDSGIEVFALDGRPGIKSARYAGEPVSDERNIEKLLGELDRADDSSRSARFVCWLALADGNGSVGSVEGTCAGTIGTTLRGRNGFGYDPIFVLADGRTMAEMPEEEKDLVSHRGDALRALLPLIEQTVGTGAGDA